MPFIDLHKRFLLAYTIAKGKKDGASKKYPCRPEGIAGTGIAIMEN
jgi:hypothetical protein